MVSKIILALIALNISTLVAHGNFNKISANADSSGLNSTHVKLNHQSFLYIPNGDALILDLTHTLYRTYMQNDVGIGYRRVLETIGIGANCYYMNMNEPRTFLHQISPGIEASLFDFQVSYNIYLPISRMKECKKGMIYHNPVSEFGVRYMMENDIAVGILPCYDHTNKKLGLNSSFTYALNDRYEFGIYPYLKHKSRGCLFSFGIKFGADKGIKSTHRSNEFNYSLKYLGPKNPKIFVQVPTISLPPPCHDTGVGPVDPPTVIPPPKEPDIMPWSWHEMFPFRDWKRSEQEKPEEKPKEEPLATAIKIDEFFFVPPLEQILSPLMAAPGAKPHVYA